MQEEGTHFSSSPPRQQRDEVVVVISSTWKIHATQWFIIVDQKVVPVPCP